MQPAKEGLAINIRLQCDLGLAAAAVATVYLDRRAVVEIRDDLGLDISSPRIAWSQVADYWRVRRYRHHGTYEDEEALEQAGLPGR